MNRRRLAPTLLQAWLLAGLLLAAQALGLAHRVAHGGGSATTLSAAQVFGGGHEAGSADCRLVDQLAQGDLLCGSPAPAAVAPPALADSTAFTLPRWAPQAAAAYLARAPPRG